jgi:ubiquinone biosynthesis protein COQ9
MTQPIDDSDRLVDALLPLVATQGWTDRALRQAAAACGIESASMKALFPRGAADAAVHFFRMADGQLEAVAAAGGLGEMRFSERVGWLVRKRLELWTEQRAAVRQAVFLLAMPLTAGKLLRAYWETADAIWNIVGNIDTRSDLSFYTRRALLASIVGATLLVWLADRSEGFVDSWTFLDRRMADVGRMVKLRMKATQCVNKLRPATATA